MGQVDDRESWDLDDSGNSVTQLFSGNTRMLIADFVWKWAPNGNAQRTFKLQGEYLRRDESGSLTYDSTGLARTDSFSAGSPAGTCKASTSSCRLARGPALRPLERRQRGCGLQQRRLDVPAYTPTRTTLMLDWTPSEFSRLRLQFANDRAREA